MIRKTAFICGIAVTVLSAPSAQAGYEQQAIVGSGGLAVAIGASLQAVAETARGRRLVLMPGTTIRSRNGSELGTLVGVRNVTGRQELTVRGDDGTVRAVAIDGIHLRAGEVIVNATYTDFLDGEAVWGEDVVSISERRPDNPPADPSW